MLKQLHIITCKKCKAVGRNLKGMLQTQLQVGNASFTLASQRSQKSCVGVGVNHNMPMKDNNNSNDIKKPVAASATTTLRMLSGP